MDRPHDHHPLDEHEGRRPRHGHAPPAHAPGPAPVSHQTAYERAVRLMRSAAAKAFDLDDESPGTRDAYGRSIFGQGCLLARRLVERGVPFVEVTLGDADGAGWDTHGQNFP